MSGSAANASARRRRAGNGEEETSTIQQNNKQEKRGISPLQILQAHESRLKKLEEKTREITYNEENNDIKQVKNISVNSKDIEKKVKENLEILSNNNKAIEERTKSDISTLSKKIDSLVNENISLKTEINELKDIKLLLIKTQTLGLETSKDVYDIKSELIKINTILEDNKNLQINEEDNMMNKDENSVFDLLKHMLVSKMGNNLNNYDEGDKLSEEINGNINLSEYKDEPIDLTNEINDLSELNNDQDDLFNKLKDLTENINLIDDIDNNKNNDNINDNNELKDVNKIMIQEEVLNEINEVLKVMNDNIDKDEVLDQRIDDVVDEQLEEKLEEKLEDKLEEEHIEQLEVSN